MSSQRLQKVLAQAGVASRRAAETLITEGRVRVNGRIVRELGARANLHKDRVEVDGRRLVAQRHVYFLMHKPRGVVTTLDDPEGRKTVKDLLRNIRERVFPVGRLDFQTSGALLLTNDGDLAQALLHPTRAVPKTYNAKLEGKLDEGRLDQLRAGVVLDDGHKTAPAEVHVLRSDDKATSVEITIAEGKNRQIHRMGEAIARSVLRLTRISFAGLTLEGLRPGQLRPLTARELTELKETYLHKVKRRKHGHGYDTTGRFDEDATGQLPFSSGVEEPSAWGSEEEPTWGDDGGPLDGAADAEEAPAARSAQTGRSGRNESQRGDDERSADETQGGANARLAFSKGRGDLGDERRNGGTARNRGDAVRRGDDTQRRAGGARRSADPRRGGRMQRADPQRGSRNLRGGAKRGADPRGEYEGQPRKTRGADPRSAYGSQPRKTRGADPGNDYVAQPRKTRGADPGREYGSQPRKTRGADPRNDYVAQPRKTRGADPRTAQPRKTRGADPGNEYGSQPRKTRGADPRNEYGARNSRTKATRSRPTKTKRTQLPRGKKSFKR